MNLWKLQLNGDKRWEAAERGRNGWGEGGRDSVGKALAPESSRLSALSL